MCVVSMVMDHYKDRFDRQWPWGDTRTGDGIPTPMPTNPWRMPAPINPMIPQEDFKRQIERLREAQKPQPSPEVEALRELIKEFREALAAAKLVDVLTDQPDCEDPVKAKLEDRVKALEKHLGL
jgi:hypothetical protein